MSLTIEAICYDLGIPEKEARLYGFLHEKVVEYGGVPQFVQNKEREIAKLREMSSSEITRSIREVFPRNLQQILDDIPLDTFDPEHDSASYIQSLVAMLEDPASLETRIGVYRDRILPVYDQYTEERVIETLSRKRQRQQEKRKTIDQQVENLLGNSDNPETKPK